MTEENGASLTVLNSHSVGCGSQNEGHIEFMVHRQLNQDDGRGLSEAVRDASRPEVRLWFKLGPSNEGKSMFELQQLRQNNPLHVLFSANSESTLGGDDMPTLNFFSPMRVELPPYIHVMSFLVRDGTTDDVVLRLRSLSNSAQTFTLPANGDGDQRFFSNLNIERLSESTLTSNYRSNKFEDPLVFTTSTETVDEATKSLGNLREKQASQNTEEEGVFLSKSALERSRKILGIAEPEFNVGPGDIATYTLVLTDSMSKDERAKWLDKLKNTYPTYAKQLNKPKAFSLMPPAQKAEQQLPPLPPRPPPPQMPQHQQKNPPPAPPQQMASSQQTKPEKVSHNDGLQSNALADAEKSGILPDGFEYGFVMGAVSFASICFLFNLRGIGVACRGGDTKKRR